MEENLVIVESPAKAKTIEKFLGKNYLVKSSFGHVRDLSPKKFSIDIENNFEPDYIVPDDKKNVIKELKKLSKEASTVWIASDEDREGEAIAWHLSEVLELKDKNTKRIVFHEITKDAILKAIKQPRRINKNLVDAQQARRILDRIVGYELSPVLWKKVKPSLSAGRVQSVAVRLLVEREREIMNHKSTSSFRIIGAFEVNESPKKELKAELKNRIKEVKETKIFLEHCKNATFKIASVTRKPSKRNPAAPFTTSTLQQEASRKLGFSVSRTMSVAQKLYENGRITYMRTDSVNLSETVLKAAKEVISKEYGEKYVKIKQFTNKSKGAQEAHEAIRPTYLENQSVSGTSQEKKLYDLIWKRTVASQMKEAELEKTTVDIEVSGSKHVFQATGEVIKFDGFLKVYIETTEEEEQQDEKISNILPPVKEGQLLDMNEIVATEKFTHHPPRYTEASLVRKLEELGIGRPSTYAPTISTIQNRGYVVKEERPGRERKYKQFLLEDKQIKEKDKTEITGAEKNKLFPSDIGMVVTDFLVEHFNDILNYNFTAEVEKQFDEIAEGKVDWTKMLDQFYHPFHKEVEETLEKSEKNKGKRQLGVDPESDKPLYVLIGRYGPMAQIGDMEDDEKPKFASLLKGQYLETITLEEALKLFRLPRNIGEYEGKEVVIGIGRFGPYVRHDGKFASLKKEDDPFSIELDKAIERIEEKRERERNKIIKEFKEDPELKVLKGRWGPYISYGKNNYKIPKGQDATKLTYKKCQQIMEQSKKK